MEFVEQPARRLDREKQRKLLIGLANSYPNWAPAKGFGVSPSDDEWVSLTSYLAEHGLVTIRSKSHHELGTFVESAAITAAGLDFLQDDGGLTAILGVVTVRLEAETIRTLLAAKVEASDLAPEEKSKLKAGLQKLGGEALSKVSGHLVEKAIDNWPLALEVLHRAMS